jgi:hypothetical protein
MVMDERKLKEKKGTPQKAVLLIYEKARAYNNNREMLKIRHQSINNRDKGE